MIIPDALENGRDRRHFIPPFIVLAALFLIYPNRTILFAPDWIIFAFSTASISLFCAGALLFVPDRMRELFRCLPRWFKYALFFFALIAILHIAKNFKTYSLADAARSVSYLTIPLFACLYRDELKRLLPWALTLLWFLTVAQSFVEHFMQHQEALGGLPLNRNWNASLILISAPFAVYTMFRLADSILKRFLLLLLIVLPSMLIFMLCNSLAAYLSIPAALFLLLLMNRKRLKVFLITSGALLILAIAGFFLCKTYCPAFQQYLEKDDRIAIFAASARMIANSPVSGVGIPSFEQEFLPYIRTEAYFLRDHATDRTNHPHNHVLFIAAGMGLAGLAAWLALWLVPVLLHAFRKEPDPEETIPDRLICFAWLVLAFHSMMDLVLFQEPTNILGLLFTGWIWAGVFKRKTAEAKEPETDHSPLYRFGGKIIAGLALLMALCNLFSAVHFRISHRLWLDGREQEAQKHIRLMLLTAGWDNTHYYLYQSVHRLPPDEMPEVLDRISASATPDFAHINLLRGRLLLLHLNQPEAAKEAFFRDAELYPLHIGALYNLWQVALIDRNETAAKLIAGEINYRLERRKLDARILNPFPAPQDARISGPDAEKAMTHDSN